MMEKEKAGLLRRLCESRQAVRANQFERAKGRVRYYPAKTKDGEYRPLAFNTCQTHLSPKETTGLYPPIAQDKDRLLTAFLCLNLSAVRLLTAKEMNTSLSQLIHRCSITEIRLYVEVPLSGVGRHLWILLEHPGAAWKMKKSAGSYIEIGSVENAKWEKSLKQDWFYWPSRRTCWHQGTLGRCVEPLLFASMAGMLELARPIPRNLG